MEPKKRFGHPMDETVLQNFKAHRVISGLNSEVWCLDFFRDGQHLTMGCLNGNIMTLDLTQGRLETIFETKHCGVGHLFYMHSKDFVIHTSIRGPDSIRYLNLVTKEYVRLYTAHTKRIIALSTMPHIPYFITTSLDKTVKLWDIRQKAGCASVTLPGVPLASLNPTIYYVAVGYNGNVIEFRDLRKLNGDPIKDFYYENSCNNWTGMKYTPDGSKLVITTAAELIGLVDAITGEPSHKLTCFKNKNGRFIDPSISLDSQFICGGSEDGKLHIWATTSGDKLCSHKSSHEGLIRCTKFNPIFPMIASAGKKISLWWPPAPKSART